MNINLRYIIIALAALLGITTSCTDESTDIPAVKTEGLTLMVPDAVRFASRAAGDNGEAELTYSSLYFFAFPQNGSGELLITPLATGNGSPGFVTDGYRTYPLTLKNGTYRFFLVANHFAAGLESSALPQDEDALKEELLSFDENFNFMIPVTGIPMSADAGDFSFRDASGAKKSVSLFEYTGQAGSLIADLTFCYAKVTVIPQDAGGNPIAVSDLEVKNYSKREPVISAGTSYNSYGSVDHSEAEFEPVTTADGDKISAYTFYVPERYITAAGDDTEATVMTMTIDDKEVSITLGQTDSMEPNGSYIVPEADELPFIRRGYHYIYTLTTTVNINVKVEPWTPHVLSSRLGPVYLHIEKDEYEITAGEDTKIWFDSSVGNDLTIESPTYTTDDGTTYKVYESSVNATADTLTVWVNDAIPASEYQNIKDGEGKYDYFHIVAGNIMKRINVTPLTLDYYLRLNPENIALDVKLRVASGEYSSNVPVSIRSNYPQVKVTLADGWDNVPAATANTPKPLKLLEPASEGQETGPEVPAGDGGSVSIMSGTPIRYYVYFSGMNSGMDFWKDKRTLTFNVTGIDKDGNAQEVKTVTINVIPSILNYKIHFKADGWNHPHIYVYQCLEFPADYKGVDSDDTPLANKPIGYTNGNDRNAALEYSFTGGISFRGWDFPDNHDLLYKVDGTQILTPSVTFDTGFYMFTGQDMSWNIQKEGNTADTRYNLTYDFCKKHREDVSSGSTFTDSNCPNCKWMYGDDNETVVNNAMNRLWPGIMMKKETTNDGWYEFELTGIAEPGKTLIMFGNGHSNSNPRFPGGGQVGVPLFDFPSREGWFEYNGNIDDRVNNNFKATKPEGPKTYRIYWPRTISGINGNSKYIYLYDEPALSYPLGTWPGAVGYGWSSNSEYYFCEFTKDDFSGSYDCIFHNGSGSERTVAKFNTTSFTKVDGIYSAYYDGSWHSGKPAAAQITVPSDKYRIYWPKEVSGVYGFANHIYMWSGDYKIAGAWPGTIGTAEGNYYYWDFDSSDSSASFSSILNNGNSGNNNQVDGPTITLSTFTPDTSKKRNCAYCNGTKLEKGRP